VFRLLAVGFVPYTFLQGAAHQIVEAVYPEARIAIQNFVPNRVAILRLTTVWLLAQYEPPPLHAPFSLCEKLVQMRAKSEKQKEDV